MDRLGGPFADYVVQGARLGGKRLFAGEQLINNHAQGELIALAVHRNPFNCSGDM